MNERVNPFSNLLKAKIREAPDLERQNVSQVENGNQTVKNITVKAQPHRIKSNQKLIPVTSSDSIVHDKIPDKNKYTSRNNETSSIQRVNSTLRIENSVTIYEDIKSKDRNIQRSLSINVSDLKKLVPRKNLFHDGSNTGYCRIDIGPVKKLSKIDSEEFYLWLVHRLTQYYNCLPTEQCVKSVLMHLSHYAKSYGKEIEPFCRVGSYQGNIIIDICDRRNNMIWVNNKYCGVGNNIFIDFRKYDHQRSLPIPCAGGNLTDLIKYTNIKDENQVVLFLCWLVVSLIPYISRPFLWIQGPSGSGKTHLANRVKSLIDPEEENSIILPSNLSQIADILDTHSIPFFDNVSVMTKPVSDLFCQYYSGGKFVKEIVNSDFQETMINLKGTAILASTELSATEKSLLHRTLLINLNSISEEKIQTNVTLDSNFNKEMGKIMGALINALSRTLAIVRTIKVESKTRTADFDEYGMAAAVALGFGQEGFLKARLANEEMKMGKFVKEALAVINQSIELVSDTPDNMPAIPNELQITEGSESTYECPAPVLDVEPSGVSYSLEDMGIHLVERLDEEDKDISLKEITRTADESSTKNIEVRVNDKNNSSETEKAYDSFIENLLSNNFFDQEEM